ncbi:MAG: cell division ATP-binding protein FtsE [Clostridia bacterium]|nr:cell division ATP-binding protein FtsE [Clostridia bacterium]
MILFQNVEVIYSNDVKALAGVDLRVDEGEFLFISGESGAGKSTMIRLMTGEVKPTSGSLLINGYRMEKLKERKVPALRRTLGVVYQDFRLIKNMTAEENVAFAMRVLGASRKAIRERVAYVMDLVGLKDKMKSRPNELSGGEQQRVAIARALVNNPSLIIADEPTGNLDPMRSYEIIDLLSKINGLGTTVVVITHDYELLRRFAHRVIYIEKGVLAGDRVLKESGTV